MSESLRWQGLSRVKRAAHLSRAPAFFGLREAEVSWLRPIAELFCGLKIGKKMGKYVLFCLTSQALEFIFIGEETESPSRR